MHAELSVWNKQSNGQPFNPKSFAEYIEHLIMAQLSHGFRVPALACGEPMKKLNSEFNNLEMLCTSL